MIYKGSCHCGKVAYEVEMDALQEVMECNIQHRFCTSCGIHAYGMGRDRQGNPMAMVNVRCLEGVDFEALPVKRFDGAKL